MTAALLCDFGWKMLVDQRDVGRIDGWLRLVDRWLIPFRDGADEDVDWVLLSVETFLIWSFQK